MPGLYLAEIGLKNAYQLKGISLYKKAVMRTRLLSLKTVNDKSVLCYDLTNKIVEESIKEIEVVIDGRSYIIEKRNWLNTCKVWDNGKTFFIVCSKRMNARYAKKVLLEYSIELVDKRLDNLNQFKSRLIAELA